MKPFLRGSALLLVLAACESTDVDMAEPRRVVGTENAVRVDAQVIGEEVRSGSHIPITYVITNQRPTPIAIADLIPETTFDEESYTFTVNIGAEIPGNALLPRLVTVAPGEKKTFSTKARMQFIRKPQSLDPRTHRQAAFRIKVNFLGDTAPFRQLLDIKENAVADPKLADALFPVWLEKNEVVYTNAIPMKWGAREDAVSPAERRPTRRPRGF